MLKPLRSLVRIVLVLAIILLITLVLWYFNRPLPEALAEHAIFEGVTYERVVQRDPYPLIYHVVKVDLDAPGISFLVTPRDELDAYDYAARTTSQFLGEFGPQVAINGDFYDPWRDFGPWDYYPHVGDGVNVRGLTIAQAQMVTDGYAPSTDFATLYVTDDNHITFSPPESEVQQAISGLHFLADGKYIATWGDDAYLKRPHPRTAVALDATGRTFIIVIVDGRQPNYSAGATLDELADILLAYGGRDAINLDGGGSSTLVQAGFAGESILLNSPVHTHIPRRERPIANHLGIFADPLP